MKSSAHKFMRPLISFIIAVVCIGLFAGCASRKPSPRTGNETVSEQLEKLRKGMHAEDVKLLLGAPDSVRPVTTPKGGGEQWIYSETTLVKNINGSEAASGHIYMQKIGGRKDRMIFLNFENGVLVSEGF